MSMLLQAKNVGTLLDIVLQITSTTAHALVGQTTQPILHERTTSAFAHKVLGMCESMITCSICAQHIYSLRRVAAVQVDLDVLSILTKEQKMQLR